MTINKPISKFIALILVSICVAFITVDADRTILAKLDLMSPTDYMQYQRHVYTHSFAHHYILWLMIGGFYIASVEFIAYFIGLFFKKPAA